MTGIEAGIGDRHEARDKGSKVDLRCGGEVVALSGISSIAINTPFCA